MIYYSQSGQDAWVDRVLNQKTNGYFVDIGAYDGVQTSNSYFFELNRNWSGVCIEADITPFNLLNSTRKSKNYFGAVSSYTGECFFSTPSVSNDGVKIPCYTLNTILTNTNSPNYIDYLSIDVEGHEYSILSAVDYSKWVFGLMTVEHNLYCSGPENKDKIYNLLKDNGYIRIIDNVLCQDSSNPSWYLQPYEDWYAHESITGDLNI